MVSKVNSLMILCKNKESRIKNRMLFLYFLSGFDFIKRLILRNGLLIKCISAGERALSGMVIHYYLT